MSVVVGAYAASPAHRAWDPAFERELFALLAEAPEVGGLELPWLGRLHPHDDDWLLRHVPEGFDVALTALPHVVARATATRGYGLSSRDEEGRSAAVRDVVGLHDAATRLTGTGRAAVRVVELHTAPQGGGDVDALAASLAEIAAWDWGGAELVIEHCDAAVPGQAYEKGFLPLADEIEAIRRSGAPVGLWLNWGRSAIELRDADAVAGQVAQAAACGMLRGLAFSGAASVDGSFGPAWADAHLPISRGDDDPSRSLLTPARVAGAIAAAVAAAAPAWLGLKVSRRPDEETPRAIVDGIRSQAALVEAAAAARAA